MATTLPNSSVQQQQQQQRHNNNSSTHQYRDETKPSDVTAAIHDVIPTRDGETSASRHSKNAISDCSYSSTGGPKEEYASWSRPPSSSSHLRNVISSSSSYSFSSNHHINSNDNDDEGAPLLRKDGGGEETAVYSRRWYVLAVYSLAAAVQGGGWGTWGPITQTAKSVFGWTDATVALQPLWGNLAYILVAAPVTWFMVEKGLRRSMILSSLFLAVGFGFRCVSSDPVTGTWLINVGQILIGIGGSVPFSGVSLLAVTWFPPNQRATATAIASAMAYIGVALSFIVGPEMMPASPNITDTVPNFAGGHEEVNTTGDIDIGEQTDAVMKLLYYEAGVAGLLLLLVVVYFPDKPPRPPSRSAALPRNHFGKGLRALGRNHRFWLLAVSYCVPVGAYGAFGNIIDINLNPIGISQTTAGWLGFYSTIGGCVSGLLASWLADVFMRRLKMFLIVLCVGAAGSSAWFLLLVLQYIHYDLVSVYVSSILIGVFINGAIPLFYEAACEVSYPVPEGVTTGAMTLANNMVGVVFFALLFIPGIGVKWMNWVVLGTVVVALPLLMVLKEHYARIDIDVEIDVPPPSPSVQQQQPHDPA